MQNAMDVGGEDLDTLFRAHFERIARVIGRVIHDQARAEELAVEVFLRWNPLALFVRRSTNCAGLDGKTASNASSLPFARLRKRLSNCTRPRYRIPPSNFAEIAMVASNTSIVPYLCFNRSRRNVNRQAHPTEIAPTA